MSVGFGVAMLVAMTGGLLDGADVGSTRSICNSPSSPESCRGSGRSPSGCGADRCGTDFASCVPSNGGVKPIWRIGSASPDRPSTRSRPDASTRACRWRSRSPASSIKRSKPSSILNSTRTLNHEPHHAGRWPDHRCCRARRRMRHPPPGLSRRVATIDRTVDARQTTTPPDDSVQGLLDAWAAAGRGGVAVALAGNDGELTVAAAGSAGPDGGTVGPDSRSASGACRRRSWR